MARKNDINIHGINTLEYLITKFNVSIERYYVKPSVPDACICNKYCK